MSFTLLDWSAIVGYLAITLLLGFWFRKRSGKSVDDYFVSGRNVNWWLAGTSMVATTFAADTPLVVTGLVYTQGISGNWLWWGSLLSGMMTVFLFARLWRRSGLLTDVQFAEIRYSGQPAAFLRGFRAVYLGLLMNCVILGWVTKAMTSIVATTLGGTPLLLNVGHWVAPLGGVWAAPMARRWPSACSSSSRSPASTSRSAASGECSGPTSSSSCSRCALSLPSPSTPCAPCGGMSAVI